MKLCPVLLLAARVLLSSAAYDASCPDGDCPAHGQQGPQMLQRTSITTQEVAHEEHGKDTPTPAAGYIYPDGISPVAVPRKLVSGYPVEVLHKIPIRGGITVNGTHAYIPYYSVINAEMIRHTSALGIYEYGQTNMKSLPTPISVMSDRAVVGFAEKFHVLNHTGAWDTSDLEAALADQQARGPEGDAAAKAMRAQRNQLVNLFALASSTMKSLMRAGVDGGVLMALRASTAAEGGAPAESMIQRLRALKRDMRSRNRVVKSAFRGTSFNWRSARRECGRHDRECINQKRQEALLSLRQGASTNCIHFESVDGLELGTEGWTVPLDRKMVAYRGQTVFTPIKRFALLSGTAVFFHTRRHIYLYQGMSTFESIDHIDTPEKTAGEFFIGTVDGTNDWAGPDLRMPPPAPNPAGPYFYQMMKAIPIDYTYLFSDPNDVCPTGKLQNVSALMAGFDVRELMLSTPTQEQLMDAASHIDQACDCTVTFLGGDQPGTHGYGIAESIAFVHGVFETPPTRAMDFFGVDPAEGDHWNALSTP